MKWFFQFKNNFNRELKNEKIAKLSEKRRKVFAKKDPREVFWSGLSTVKRGWATSTLFPWYATGTAA